MRHIDPKDSTVFQEFERMAAEKGWIVQAALDPGVADQIRKEVNAVATMLPKTNAVLDLLIPIAETGGDNTELRHALDALRASVMDPFMAKGFDEQGGEARSLYHSARSMLHAPEGQGHMWLNGLLSLRDLLTKHYGQTVERSPAVPQEIDTELAPAEMSADDGQAADTGFLEGGSPKWPEADPVMRREIAKLWADLEADEQKVVLAKTKAPPYVAPGTPHFYSFFARPENFKVLRDATPGWVRGPGLDVLQKRKERAERAPGAAPQALKWYSDPVVGQVQRVLMGLGADLEPDNSWGPLTNAAWNAVVAKHGLEKYGLKLMPKIFPGDQSSPSLKEMEFMVRHGPALAVIEKKPAPAAGPAPVETGPMPPEHIPGGYPADDGLLERAAAVVTELVSLANDLDAMGAAEAAEAIDAQLKMYKEAADKLYDITGETGEQLVGKAHPGGGPTVAPAQEEGGKVETIVEGHKKMREKATKAPTGKQAAFVAKQLAALANRLDSEGKTEAAMLVDKTLDELRRASRRPFADSLRKEGKGEKKAGVDAVELDVIFSGMEQALEAIASTVQDQVDVTETLIETNFPIWWGTRNYGAEFDELAEEARTWVKQQQETSSQLAADPKRLMDAVRHATGLASALIRIRAIYSRLSPYTILGTWDLNTERAYKQYLDRLARLQKISGYSTKKEKKPREETARMPGRGKAPTAKGGPANDSLQATVRKIVNSIDAAYRGGAADRNLLDATFKNIDIPGVTTPGTRGLRKALEVLKRAKSMRGKVYDEVDAQDYNDWLFNKILTPMKRGLKIAGAAEDAPLMKTAAARPPPEFGGGRKPARRGRRGRRAPARAGRPDLTALQGLMEKLGYDLGTYGADGKWGRFTAAAWERLRKETAAMKGPALPAAPPVKSDGPPANAVRLASRVASYILSVKGGAAKMIELAPNVKVPESALADPQAFISALARIPASGIKFESRRDMFSKENLAAATDLLSKYRDALRKPGNPEAWRIWTEGGGAPALRRRFQLIDALLAQLPGAGAKVPPTGYGYEGGSERLPFGTLEGGPGKVGPVSGRPGAGGAAGAAGGYRAFFDPRSVVQETLKLLPDDLLDAMANTRQFIWYANNVWERGRGMKAKGDDRRAAALAYITFLRDRLGRLRQRLTPAMSRQLGAQAQNIKDRIMLAVSYMSTLEDDLRHGSL